MNQDEDCRLIETVRSKQIINEHEYLERKHMVKMFDDNYSHSDYFSPKMMFP